jgi:DNA-binding CsgD family transcriptional regulator
MRSTSELSNRERQVLDCRARGLSYKDMGPSIGISINTAKHYLANAFRKLSATTSIQAIHNLQTIDHEAARILPVAFAGPANSIHVRISTCRRSALR